MATAHVDSDPRQLYPKPPFPVQHQRFPGSDRRMQPTPDHGEKTYEGTGKLQGRSALITGGDSGIGRAVALAYAREGADVLISYLDEEEDARETVQLISSAGRKGVSVAGDIRDQSHCEHLVNTALSEFGRLDILINNAAYQMSRDSLDEMSVEMFDRVFKTNIYAMFYLCKAALPQMKPGGSIINTASIQAYDPSPQLLPYAATKSAIVGFTKALAPLAMERGVRANVVAPGPVWTPLIPYSMPEEKVTHFGENTLLKRPAQPAELAPLYVWLASDQASYVTAEVFGATGGSTPF